MSDTYTKLFSSITESTIVGEPVATRWMWVTLLAMADSRGCVYGAVPGLARRANITLQETEAALATFYAPDPYSRTKDHEGRRIEAIDGGWRLLNHAKYAAIRNEAERTAYKRNWDRENRPSGHARQSDGSPTQSDSSDAPDKSQPESDAPTTPTPALTPALKKELPASPGGTPPSTGTNVVKLDPFASVPDPIFGSGLAFLLAKSVPERGARSFLGALRKDVGDLVAAELIARAEREDVSDPLAWLRKAAHKRLADQRADMGFGRAAPYVPAAGEY